MHLTKSAIAKLTPPSEGQAFHRDDKLKGFALRITAKGTQAFVLEKLVGRRVRRITLGRCGAGGMSVEKARKKAEKLIGHIREGRDPAAEIEADRNAKTVGDLCDRFIEEYLPRKRPKTVREYKAAIEGYIRPALKHRKLAEVSFSDIDSLHRKITKSGKRGRGAPYVANRTVAVLSKMFSQAIRWRWRADNPCKGVERNHEEKRQRYLSPTEIAALSGALAGHKDTQAANIVRLLLLTGARRGEVLSMRWQDVDLEAGVWTKPSAHTKQKTEHRVPLSAPAKQLLSEVHEGAEVDAEFVFPGRSGGHRVEFKRAWAEMCLSAGIASARAHDLRHTYASMLASSGLSLPIIGALLGHTEAATTARYSHLFDDPLRQATERVGALVKRAGVKSAKIVRIEGARRA
jgi:integrase